jgi:hypothetical protein
LMHLRIRRPFIPVEPRSYPRVHQPLSAYPPVTPYFNHESHHDHWNGKSTFPNFKMFPDGESSKSKDEMEMPRRQKFDQSFQPYPPNIGRAYFEGVGVYDSYQPRATRKCSDNHLEKFFSQMRITPRTRDVIPKDVDPGVIRPLPSRPGGNYTTYQHESSAPNTPNDTDESISGESLGTSSGNSFNSVNGSVGNHVPEKNKVILEKIKMGLDTRTTVMIKNVPNKYTQVISH